MALLTTEFLNSLLESPNDFDCIPFSSQVRLFAEKVRHHGHLRFSASDIADLFQLAAMKSPRSGRPIRCSPKRAQEQLDKLVIKGDLDLVSSEPGMYEFSK